MGHRLKRMTHISPNCETPNFAPGLIDTQITLDVVSGDAQV